MIRIGKARAGAFPAHAGMNRPDAENLDAYASVPRPRGDEPPGHIAPQDDMARSPPTRG